MKNYDFHFRISEEEIKKIRENAKKADMTTTAYLINRALCDDKIVILDDLRPVCHELRKIGTNLNQLAILAHRGQISCVNLTAISEEVRNLWQPLNLLTEKTRHTLR